MITKLAVIAFQLMNGAVLAAGGGALAGLLGLPMAMGFVLAFVCWMGMWIAIDRDNRAGWAVKSKEIFDSLLDEGCEFKVKGRPWKRGCRIDPDTDAVIDPMLSVSDAA